MLTAAAMLQSVLTRQCSERLRDSGHGAGPPPTTARTILQHDGPNHLGLRRNAPPGNSDGRTHLGFCAPLQSSAPG